MYRTGIGSAEGYRMAMPASFLVAAIGAPAPWYDGIQAVKVFAPGDAVEQFAWNLYNTTSTAQFGSARHALLLKAGKYSAQIPVGFYTSLIGVGASARDVTVESFYTLDDPQVGNACDNFWRSVEGLTATMTSQDITWAASQAAPLRRVHVLGSLTLSEEGPGTHWSSGGFLADSIIEGSLKMGTQQQVSLASCLPASCLLRACLLDSCLLASCLLPPCRPDSCLLASLTLASCLPHACLLDSCLLASLPLAYLPLASLTLASLTLASCLLRSTLCATHMSRPASWASR